MGSAVFSMGIFCVSSSMHPPASIFLKNNHTLEERVPWHGGLSHGSCGWEELGATPFSFLKHVYYGKIRKNVEIFDDIAMFASTLCKSFNYT